MSVRAQFAAALGQDLLEGYRILDHARSLDSILDPVIMLERTTVEKSPNAMGGYLTTFAIHVVGPVTDRDRADDALDDVLDDVLLALDEISWCNWTRATRATFLETYPSYTIAVQTITAKTEGV